MDILAQICADKNDFVEQAKRQFPITEVKSQASAMPPTRSFADNLRKAIDCGRYGFICEIKKASPSKGLIRPDFDPPALARAYEKGGAACLSILTDEKYFMGHADYLKQVREVTSLPLLRKDFFVDEYQIYEAKALGADCILLIMAALTDGQAQHFEGLAHELGLDVLIEVHDQEELDRALKLNSPLIGINNRNLKTMSVDIETTIELAPQVPMDRIAIAESGLASPDDLQKCSAVRANCFLIGESFMRQDDVEQAVRAFQKTQRKNNG